MGKSALHRVGGDLRYLGFSRLIFRARGWYAVFDIETAFKICRLEGGCVWIVFSNRIIQTLWIIFSFNFVNIPGIFSKINENIFSEFCWRNCTYRSCLEERNFFTLQWNIINYNAFYLAIDLSRSIRYIYLVTLLVESEVMKHKA